MLSNFLSRALCITSCQCRLGSPMKNSRPSGTARSTKQGSSSGLSWRSSTLETSVKTKTMWLRAAGDQIAQISSVARVNSCARSGSKPDRTNTTTCKDPNPAISPNICCVSPALICWPTREGMCSKRRRAPPTSTVCCSTSPLWLLRSDRDSRAQNAPPASTVCSSTFAVWSLGSDLDSRAQAFGTAPGEPQRIATGKLRSRSANQPVSDPVKPSNKRAISPAPCRE
mmetsp:Transcript_93946/g.214844  ORF Transcript_93946/g.214844 Transcript_93946/m.214844 type:complete len:227 (-) Transcript_93946:125-805(-)